MRDSCPLNLRGEEAAVEVDDVRGKAHVLDPSIWFTKFLAARAPHEYLTDDPVFSQGEPANAVFYIQCGEVRLTARSPDGEQAVISVLSEGCFVGESCLAGQTLCSATASADLRSTMVRIEKQTMTDMLHSDPEFAERFLIYTLSRSIRMEDDLVDHLFNSSEGRLARMQR